MDSESKDQPAAVRISLCLTKQHKMTIYVLRRQTRNLSRLTKVVLPSALTIYALNLNYANFRFRLLLGVLGIISSCIQFFDSQSDYAFPSATYNRTDNVRFSICYLFTFFPDVMITIFSKLT